MTEQPLTMLVGSNHNQTSNFQYFTFADLLERVKSPVRLQGDVQTAKADAPFCAPHNAPAKTKDTVLSHGKFTMLWADLDEGDQDKAAIQAQLTEIGIESYAIYSTASSEPNNKRWRVLVELEEAATFEKWHTLQSYLTYSLAGDAVALRPQQILYLPFECEQTQHFETAIGEGYPLDTILSDFETKAREHQQEQEAKAAQKAAKAPTKPKPRVSLAQGQQSPIDLFNVAYDVASLLDSFGYKRVGKKYIHPNSSSGAAGVTLLDDGRRYYSHHSSDPLADGHKHDAFDLFVHWTHRGDFDAAVKQAANDLDQQGQKDRQREHAKAKKVEAVLFNAVDQQQAESPTYQHPLTKIVDLSAQPKPPNWVLPNFIAEGLVMIAGGHGVGKTTALLPLAMAVAGVHDSEYRLAPKHWRHVVYITEDIHQAQRIMTGYGEHLDWNNKDIFQNMRERVHVVEAHRMSASIVARAGAFYREKFSRTVTTTATDGQEYTAELLPLIVIDTMAATIELENENDNSEASQAVAALKQQFEGLPTWIVGHVAKANLGRSESVTLRGAGAFEADANQVLYLVQDEQTGARWLTRGKTRFESPWQELEIKSDHRIITVTNQFGDAEELVLRWSIASPPDDSRAERAEKAKTERDRLEAEELKQVILTNVAQRYAAGSPLNKTALRDVTGRSAAKTSNAIATLIADAWLHEIEVPAKERLKNKHSFLVALDDQERAEFLESGVIPEAKLWIPESWKKQPEAG